MPKEVYDLIVVGGGVVGAATVWRARVRNSGWRILWLDQGKLCSGCSSYSGGLVTRWGTSAELRSLTRESLSLLDEAEATLGCELASGRSAYFVCEAEMAKSYQARFLESPPLLAPATPAQFLAQANLMGHVIHGPFSVSRIDALRFVSTIAGWVAKRNTEIRQGVRITEWCQAKNAVELQTADGLALLGNRVVFATGPWGMPGPGSVFPDQSVRVKRVSAFHIETPPLAGAPVLMFPDHDAFLLPVPEENRWVFSFRSKVWDVVPEHASTFMTVEDRAVALAIINLYTPEFAKLLEGGRAFCDAYRPERSPLVVRLHPDIPIAFAGVCSGAGVRLALGIAEQAISSVT